MEGAVKMPSIQAKANVSGRVQQSVQAADTGNDFIKLLQGKKDLAKTLEEKNTKDTSSVKADGKETQDAENLGKDVSVKESEEPKEIDPEEALQQAAVQQTAAWMAGLLTESLQTEEAPTVSEEEISQVGEILTDVLDGEVPANGNAEETMVSMEEEPVELAGETNLVKEDAVQEDAGKEDVSLALEKNELPEKAAAAEMPAVQEKDKAETSAETNAVKAEALSQRMRDAGRQVEQKPEEGKQNRSELWENDFRRSDVQVVRDGENGQAAGVESFRMFGQQEQHSLFTQKSDVIPMKTSPDTLPQDLGKTLASNLTQGNRTLTVELEPASLGKLTIRLVYEGSRAAVSIMASNPKTLEMLNEKASEIAQILKDKTGQETLIYTQQPEHNEDNYDRNPDGRGYQRQNEQRQDKNEQHQMDSFAQQLRLGLI